MAASIANIDKLVAEDRKMTLTLIISCTLTRRHFVRFFLKVWEKGRSTFSFSYSIPSVSVKHLRVTLDSRLTSREHVNIKVRKTDNSLWVCRRSWTFWNTWKWNCRWLRKEWLCSPDCRTRAGPRSLEAEYKAEDASIGSLPSTWHCDKVLPALRDRLGNRARALASLTTLGYCALIGCSPGCLEAFWLDATPWDIMGLTDSPLCRRCARQWKKPQLMFGASVKFWPHLDIPTWVPFFRTLRMFEI